MKMLFLSLFFLSLILIFSAKDVALAYDCTSRDPSCPSSTYPQCTTLGPRHTACPPSNTGGTNPCKFSSNGTDYCAYVIPSTVRYSCNSAHQCILDPNGNLDSCTPDPCNAGGGTTGSGGNLLPVSGSWGSLQEIGKILSHPPSGLPQTGYQNIFSVGITLLIIAAILLSLFFLVWGGFDWLTSGGDKQKLHQARQKITMAIIGLVIVFLAFFVVNLIYNFFGVGGAGGGGGGGAGPKLY